MQPVPKPVAVARAKARCQFHCQRPVTGTNQILTQLNFVRRENADAAPTTRDGDISTVLYTVLVPLSKNLAPIANGGTVETGENTISVALPSK